MDFLMIICRDLNRYNTFVNIIFLNIDICLLLLITVIYQAVGEFIYRQNIVLRWGKERNYRNRNYWDSAF
jgi:hypothetical protein